MKMVMVQRALDRRAVWINNLDVHKVYGGREAGMTVIVFRSGEPSIEVLGSPSELAVELTEVGGTDGV